MKQQARLQSEAEVLKVQCSSVVSPMMSRPSFIRISFNITLNNFYLASCRGCAEELRIPKFFSATPKLLSATPNFLFFGVALNIRCGVRQI